MFNFSDCIGKSLPRWFFHNVEEKYVYIFAAIRALLIPLFFFCLKPRILTHDAFPIIFISIFGLMGSISGSKLFMIGITKVDTQEKETTGGILVASLVLGLSLGSSAAWLVPYVL